MAGQTIEFANGHGYTDNLVVCNKPSIFATVAELPASIVHQLKQASYVDARECPGRKALAGG